MRSQAVLIAAYIAAVVIVLSTTILFLRIYSHTSSYRVEQYGQDIYAILASRASWTARDLAEEILAKMDAYYVKVNITVYDLLSGRVVGSDYFEVRAVGVDPARLDVRSYAYSRATRDAHLYMIYLEVGFK